ncbi:MAG: cytochrome b [Lysobacter sp.]|nr:cytochrome b [Lysobacter sp.]
MSLKNSADRWDGVSQLFHWVIVALLLVMAYLGLTMTDLPNSAHKAKVYALHKSIGLAILALAALRLLWRLHAGRPRELAMPRWQQRMATLTHAVLYALLFALPLSGWVVNSASGFPLRWFGLVRVPAIAPRDAALNALSKEVHDVLFWTLAVVVLVHATAAVWHHVVQRDATLARMLPRRWLRLRSPTEDAPHA